MALFGMPGVISWRFSLLCGTSLVVFHVRLRACSRTGPLQHRSQGRIVRTTFVPIIPLDARSGLIEQEHACNDGAMIAASHMYMHMYMCMDMDV
jgi:hypothetical protein